jgi:phage gpG-like protein
MLNITIEVAELEKFTQHFTNINFAPALPGIAQILISSIAMQFESQGERYLPGGWEPLAASSVVQRKRMGFYPVNILRRGTDVTSKKSKKLVYSSENLSQSFHSRVAGNSIIIGTNVSYAPYLQYGTGRMPSRPFFPTSDNLPDEDVQDILDYIMGKLKF